MAKATIHVLCPSAYRRKAQMAPNGNLLQVLEEMCTQENLDSSEWGLIHQRKKLDLTLPWRLLGVPGNAVLDMYKLDERRAMGTVTIQLQLPDNSRTSGSFEPTVNLQLMLGEYRARPDSTIAAFDSALNEGAKLYPVCSYMSEEIIGEHALANMTLRELGLTNGTAVIRYQHRALADEDLKKVNDSVDEKIARRRRQQQQQQHQQQPVQATSVQPPAPAPPQVPIVEPVPLPATTAFNNAEYSIFRDLPVSRPATTTQQQQSTTLADALGIRISLDTQSSLQRSQPDFSDFKFPEATVGQNLNQAKSSENSQRITACERHTLAYDLTQIPSADATQSEELPDSFFELTPEDLRSVLTSLRQQSAEDNPLETRSMRERVKSTRTVAYEHIAVRFVVNSTYILQGLFHPNEPVSNLLAFVRSNLVCPQLQQSAFYLYTSPPRVVLAELTKPLVAYDLAPAAYVYLGHRTVSPLQIQLATTVSIGTIERANQLVKQYVFSRTRSMGEDEINSVSTARSTTAATATGQSQATSKRTTSTAYIDDKQLNEKLRKFLPGKK